MYNKILVAIDKSEHSTKAIAHAKSIADKFSAEVILYHSYQVPADFTDQQIMYNLSSDYIVKLEVNLKQHYQKLLDTTKEEFASAGIKTSTLLESGKVGANIVNAAEKENVDLVIIGSRGLGTMGRMVMGSVSSYVLHHTKKPLLVIE